MKMMRAVLWTQGSWMLIAALTGCGSDSGSGTANVAQFQQVCVKVCQKEAMCQPAFASEEGQCESICNSAGQGSGGAPANTTTSTVSCDFNEVLSKENACIAGTCDALDDCLTAASSSCSGGSTGGSPGAGGTSSTGGVTSSSGGTNTGGETTGAGGTTASGDCSVCDKAATCCTPLYTMLGQSTTACSAFSAASCQGYPAASQSAFIQGCNGIISAGKAEGVAECM
ncbi:MAG TPA: hypothetical protein VH142_05980 [Polyangiaceae bacterium]|jgi:hypothetical protein|nr:hypothetical protein [Polyangiaceae bacterium]